MLTSTMLLWFFYSHRVFIARTYANSVSSFSCRYCLVFSSLYHPAEFIWWPKKDRTKFLIGFVCRWCYPTSSTTASPRRKRDKGRHHKKKKKRKRQSSQKNNNCCTIIQTSYNFTTWFGMMFHVDFIHLFLSSVSFCFDSFLFFICLFVFRTSFWVKPWFRVLLFDLIVFLV